MEQTKGRYIFQGSVCTNMNGSNVEFEIHVEDEYSPKEWDSLTEDQREAYLDQRAKEDGLEYVDLGWS